MSKTRQVLKLDDNGIHLSIVYHEDDINHPYWLYRHTWELNKDGYYTKRKRILHKYRDLFCCLCDVAKQAA